MKPTVIGAKPTVIGATDRTGSHVLAEATRRAHRVTAFTRRPQRLTHTSTLAYIIHETDGTLTR